MQDRDLRKAISCCIPLRSNVLAVVLLLAHGTCLFGETAESASPYPAWWIQRDVITSGDPAVAPKGTIRERICTHMLIPVLHRTKQVLNSPSWLWRSNTPEKPANNDDSERFPGPDLFIEVRSDVLSTPLLAQLTGMEGREFGCTASRTECIRLVLRADAPTTPLLYIVLPSDPVVDRDTLRETLPVLLPRIAADSIQPIENDPAALTIRGSTPDDPMLILRVAEQRIFVGLTDPMPDSTAMPGMLLGVNQALPANSHFRMAWTMTNPIRERSAESGRYLPFSATDPRRLLFSGLVGLFIRAESLAVGATLSENVEIDVVADFSRAEDARTVENVLHALISLVEDDNLDILPTERWRSVLASMSAGRADKRIFVSLRLPPSDWFAAAPPSRSDFAGDHRPPLSLGEGLLIDALGLLGPEAMAAAGQLSWWVDRNVLTGGTVNDYAAVNQGQLKWIATNAYDEMQAYLPWSGDMTLPALVAGFSNSNNWCGVNVGQAKYVGSFFWNRLMECAYTNAYPWGEGSNDWAAVNIGQIKQLFNFSISDDTDENGLRDWWERRFFGDVGQDPDGNPDGDDLVNSNEYVYGTDPSGSHNWLLPQTVDFEPASGYAAGDLHDQNGWRASSLHGAQVSIGNAHGGNQCAALLGPDETMWHDFATTNRVITNEVFVYLSSQYSPPTNLPSKASCLVSFDSVSGIIAYDGDGAGGAERARVQG